MRASFSSEWIRHEGHLGDHDDVNVGSRESCKKSRGDTREADERRSLEVNNGNLVDRCDALDWNAHSLLGGQEAAALVRLAECDCLRAGKNSGSMVSTAQEAF